MNRLIVVSASALVLAACTDRVASPNILQQSGTRASVEGPQPHLFSPATLNAFLAGATDPATGVTYDGGGRIQLSVGRYPPGPCRGAVLPVAPEGMALLGVCAKISNPGGARLFAGALVDPGDRTPSALSLGDARLYPPGPCRNYVVGGTLVIPIELARAIAAGRGDLAAMFEFQAVDNRPGGEISGVFGASPGGPSDPGSARGIIIINSRGGCFVDVTSAAAPGV